MWTFLFLKSPFSLPKENELLRLLVYPGLAFIVDQTAVPLTHGY